MASPSAAPTPRTLRPIHSVRTGLSSLTTHLRALTTKLKTKISPATTPAPSPTFTQVASFEAASRRAVDLQRPNSQVRVEIPSSGDRGYSAKRPESRIRVVMPSISEGGDDDDDNDNDGDDNDDGEDKKEEEEGVHEALAPVEAEQKHYRVSRFREELF